MAYVAGGLRSSASYRNRQLIFSLHTLFPFEDGSASGTEAMESNVRPLTRLRIGEHLCNVIDFLVHYFEVK